MDARLTMGPMNAARIGLLVVPVLVAVLVHPAVSDSCREEDLDAQGKCTRTPPTAKRDGRAPRADGQVRLAVMEFANTSPDRQLDSLGKGLQSMVTTDLAQVTSLTLVERARLQDIQAELRLGKTALVDPRTAARFGKLAGASHLVAGSFTVVGDRMRIDGRIFTVADGKVVLAEKIEGERDAFFELEKTLVKKIVDTVGVKLGAKERGAIARVHTTDFESFRDFSNGVALFDEKKYGEAIEALRAAQNRDQDFKLATVTLAEYQDIISRLAARADELQATQTELKNLEQQKQARGEAEALKKLHEIAGRKDANDPLDRLAALYLLATAYGDITGSTHDLYRMQALEDRFALQRIADTRVLPVVRDELGLLPKTPEQVDDALARARKQLEDGRVHARVDCLRGQRARGTVPVQPRLAGDARRSDPPVPAAAAPRRTPDRRAVPAAVRLRRQAERAQRVAAARARRAGPRVPEPGRLRPLDGDLHAARRHPP
jgi:TolB-like protein